MTGHLETLRNTQSHGLEFYVECQIPSLAMKTGL